MAYKKKSPVKNYNPITGSPSNPTLIGSYLKHREDSKEFAATSKKSSGASNLDFSKGDVIGQYGKGKSKTSNPDDGIMIRDAGTNTKTVKNNKPKTTVKTKSNTSIKPKPAAKPITSSDSGDRSGGYLKNTKNFSLGVDLSMPKSKMQTTVTNARSANTDLISGRMSRRDKIAARQSRKTARVRERVGNQIERIKGRQERAGVRAGAKMARRDKGVDPGYFDSQKKLDAFEKSMDSPRATPRTSGAGNIPTSQPRQLTMPKSNQTVAKPSMKINTSKQTAIVIDDSRIKQGAKKASGGGKVSADTYKSLTGFNKMTSKPGSSGGMQRGMTRTDQTKKLTNLASGNQPRKDVKNMSSKNYLTKGITPSYKNN